MLDRIKAKINKLDSKQRKKISLIISIIIGVILSILAYIKLRLVLSIFGALFLFLLLLPFIVVAIYYMFYETFVLDKICKEKYQEKIECFKSKIQLPNEWVKILPFIKELNPKLKEIINFLLNESEYDFFAKLDDNEKFVIIIVKKREDIVYRTEIETVKFFNNFSFRYDE